MTGRIGGLTGKHPYSITYGYDANGNQTSVTSRVGDPTEATATYSYTFENRLSSSSSDTSGYGYNYDGDGNRLAVASSTPTGVTYRYFLVDPNQAYSQVLEEYDGDGVLRNHADYADDYGPLRQDWSDPATSATGSSFFLADGLGSTRQLSDTSGTIKDAYSYDAFGGDGLDLGDTPNRYRFNGQQQDDGGLYHLRARQYAPGIGRFLNHDPLMGMRMTRIRSTGICMLAGYAFLGTLPSFPVSCRATGPGSGVRKKLKFCANLC